jgi:hypothetical protein
MEEGLKCGKIDGKPSICVKNTKKCKILDKIFA